MMNNLIYRLAVLVVLEHLGKAGDMFQFTSSNGSIPNFLQMTASDSPFFIML